MSEAQIHLEDDSTDDVRVKTDDVRVKPFGASDDHLVTTKLHQNTAAGIGPRPPLPPARMPSVPPPPVAPSVAPSSTHPAVQLPSPLAVGSATAIPPAAPSFTPGAESGSTAVTSSVDVPPAPALRTSWWKALLVSTRPPADVASAPAPLDGRGAQEPIAAASAVLGLVLMIVALVVGLREAPAGFLVAPVVSAAVVIARASVAVALLVIGLTCLRAAERIYFR